MIYSFAAKKLRGLFFPRTGTAHNVQVQVKHFLPSILAGVDDGTKPVITTLLTRQSGYKLQHFTE
jgi:hypothetical protein